MLVSYLHCKLNISNSFVEIHKKLLSENGSLSKREKLVFIANTLKKMLICHSHVRDSETCLSFCLYSLILKMTLRSYKYRWKNET